MTEGQKSISGKEVCEGKKQNILHFPSSAARRQYCHILLSVMFLEYN